MVKVDFKRLPHGMDLSLPLYAHDEDSGMDVCAAVGDPVTLNPGERALIPTGLAFAVRPGFEIQVRPRSGLAVKHGVTVLNAPGTIDASYRGEVKVILINHGSEPFVIERGCRIAQLVLAQVTKAELTLVEELDETGRGNGGFGSTGIRDSELMVRM